MSAVGDPALRNIIFITTDSVVDRDSDTPLIQDALRARGLGSELVAWDSPKGESLARRESALVILRSPWNYYRHPERFLHWLEAVAIHHQLHNPLGTVRQNLHKSYLTALEGRGVNVVPTCLVPRATARALSDCVMGVAGERVVVKPAVSAGSFETRSFSKADVAQHAGWFANLVGERDMLIQPYLDEIEARGERSLVFIDGVCVHGVRKQARFSGQPESTTPIAPTPEELAFARDVLVQAEAEQLLYARVDLIERQGRCMLMELELSEPSLFLADSKVALDRMVDRIVALAAG